MIILFNTYYISTLEPIANDAIPDSLSFYPINIKHNSDLIIFSVELVNLNTTPDTYDFLTSVNDPFITTLSINVIDDDSVPTHIADLVINDSEDIFVIPLYCTWDIVVSEEDYPINIPIVVVLTVFTNNLEFIVIFDIATAFIAYPINSDIESYVVVFCGSLI